MSVSGTTSFNLLVNQIITRAFNKLGIIGIDSNTAPEDYELALDNFNMMLREWQLDGIFVSLETEGTLFLTPGQYKYQLGGTSPDYASFNPAVETQSTSALIATGTSLTVNSATGINVNDTILIVLDAGGMFATTVATVTPSTNTITLNAGITGSAASGNYVYTYTTPTGRPLMISGVRRRTAGGTDSVLSSSINDCAIQPISRKSYMDTPNKGIQGTPTMYYVDRQSTATNLYVWPSPSSSNYRLEFTFRRIVDDVSAATQIIDFPPEYLRPAVYCLASALAPDYDKELKAGLQSAQAAGIQVTADRLYAKLLRNAREKCSFKISPKLPG